MDLVGEFHKMEIDGRLSLVYQNVLKPLPQIHSPNSSDEEFFDCYESFPLQPLFLCPRARFFIEMYPHKNNDEKIYETQFKFITSPLFDTSPLFGDCSTVSHHVLPLFWCNTKDANPQDDCGFCDFETTSRDYYFCVVCDLRFHKECVESPLEISFPSHFKHSLQLHYISALSVRPNNCACCRKITAFLVYYCALGNISVHVHCAQTNIPFFIYQPKRHNHTLTLFPRQAFLVCNVCGLVNEFHLTYICAMCDFVFHSDCLNIPQTIKISRHHHRVSFIPSHPFQEASCGVCRRKVDSNYGAYSCHVCTDYVVHTRCALRTDIWDGVELEGVPEEEEDAESFERIADGVIVHCFHRHHLKLEIIKAYDASKFCQACAHPFYEGKVYVCGECDFILHESCAMAPRKKFHPLHPHPLQLHPADHVDLFVCIACRNLNNGFVYKCFEKKCCYQLDLHCALISEPFKYQGHQDSLFLALDPKEKAMCNVCKSTDDRQTVLNCIECDFIICLKCATLPYMVRYKHDDHYLTFCRGDEALNSDWCELCEGTLAIGMEKGFFKCNSCYTTLHIHRLLGDPRSCKPAQSVLPKETNMQVDFIRNNSASRPICTECNRRCPYPMFLTCKGRAKCSVKCLNTWSKKPENKMPL